MTFQEKLEKFKRGEVGFRVDSQEVSDGLTKVFEKENMSGFASTPEELLLCMIDYCSGIAGVVWKQEELMFGSIEAYPDKSFEFLELTVEELQ